MKRVAFVALGLCFGVILYAQTRGTPSQLRVRVDATGALLVSTANQIAPISYVQFSNARLAVDATGNLLVSCTNCGDGSAPSDATYITQTPNPSLSAEQALSTLSSGIMRVATTTGVITSLTNSLGIADNISDETGSGSLVFGTAPVFTTNITTPLIIGGSTTTSTITLKPTSGNAALGAFLEMVYGNDGASQGFRFDAVNGRVLVGQSVASATASLPFEVITTSTSGLVATRIQATANSNVVSLRKARGTITSLSPVLSGDGIGGFGALGYNSVNYPQTGILQFAATQDFTSTNGGTQFIVGVAPTNSLTPTTILTGIATLLTSNVTFQAAGYNSADGTAGVTVTNCTSFKNGLCVAGT